jgi:choline dehydrogenase
MTDADYIIIGAGAAGCVLAHRLVTEGKQRVLLLEAGGADDLPAIHATDLGSMTSMWGPCQQNWGYQTVSQSGMDGRKVSIAQGKGLGGGTAINAMMYVRGNRRDYDRWATMGAQGWGHADVLPFFRRSESYAGGDDAFRGRTGELSVIDMPLTSEAAACFLTATAEIGLSAVAGDPNGAQQENHAFLYQSTRIDADHRCSAATAFLDPLRGNPLLTIATGTRATRIVIEKGTATGVEVIAEGQRRHLTCTREVIVAAGAFASPHLLMLSGIGPADHLAEHGIALVQDIPGVGQNLSDHLLVSVAFKALHDMPPPQLLSEAGIFLSSQPAVDDTESPDLQFFFGPIQYADPQYLVDGPGITFVPILAQPKSVGRITLASCDPSDPPLVDPAYLSDPADVAVLVEGVRIARRMSGAKAFDGLRGQELAPSASVTSDEALAAYVRASASTVWHPVGTCKIGAAEDPMAVVDPQLRVRGVQGLRVADASVMPTITTGNTNATVIMIGEKAADLILSTLTPKS